MKNKGFTLIELIAVILILGAIALITLPIINKTIEKSKKDMLQEQINRINNTGKKYIIEKLIPNDTTEKEHSYYVTISDMVDAGYLASSDIKNPTNDTIMDGCVVANYNSSTKKFKYEYMDECIFNNNYNGDNMSIVMLLKNRMELTLNMSQEKIDELEINPDDKSYGRSGYIFIYGESGNLNKMFEVLQIQTDSYNLLKYMYENPPEELNEKYILDLDNNSIYLINDELVIEDNDTYVTYVENYINNDYINDCTDISNPLCNYELSTINLDK